jgi:hypothetical protein
MSRPAASLAAKARQSILHRNQKIAKDGQYRPIYDDV